MCGPWFVICLEFLGGGPVFFYATETSHKRVHSNRFNPLNKGVARLIHTEICPQSNNQAITSLATQHSSIVLSSSVVLHTYFTLLKTLTMTRRRTACKT